MATESKKTNPWIMVIVGLVIMVIGMYLNQTDALHLAPLKESLEKMGLPLDLTMTFAVIGVFVAVFPLINMFFFQPLDDAIHARTTELEGTFTEAEKLRSEMATMKSEYEQRLTATEADARQKIQDEIKKAKDLGAHLQAEAAAHKEELIKRAEEEIASERDRAVKDLRLNTVNLTLGATSKLIGRTLNTDDDKKLVEEFINSAEVPV